MALVTWKNLILHFTGIPKPHDAWKKNLGIKGSLIQKKYDHGRIYEVKKFIYISCCPRLSVSSGFASKLLNFYFSRLSSSIFNPIPTASTGGRHFRRTDKQTWHTGISWNTMFSTKNATSTTVEDHLSSLVLTKVGHYCSSQYLRF